MEALGVEIEETKFKIQNCENDISIVSETIAGLDENALVRREELRQDLTALRRREELLRQDLTALRKKENLLLENANILLSQGGKTLWYYLSFGMISQLLGESR